MDENDPLFAADNKVEVKFKTIKFGKVGDWFKGTLTDNSQQLKNELSPEKEMQTIFEFKAHGGSLHLSTDKVVHEAATVIEKGDFWSYITGKQIMLNQLRKAQIGTVVGFRFVEERKSKKPGFNPTKIVDIYIGSIDPEYQGESSQDR